MAMLYRIRELLARREIQERRRLTLEDLATATQISAQVLARMADPEQEYHTSTRNIEILVKCSNGFMFRRGSNVLTGGSSCASPDSKIAAI